MVKLPDTLYNYMTTSPQGACLFIHLFDVITGNSALYGTECKIEQSDDGCYLILGRVDGYELALVFDPDNRTKSHINNITAKKSLKIVFNDVQLRMMTDRIEMYIRTITKTGIQNIIDPIDEFNKHITDENYISIMDADKV